MKLHNIVESYQSLIDELSKHLKVVNKSTFKYMLKDDHKAVLESIIKDQETVNLLTESTSMFNKDIISNFIDIAKTSLKIKSENLKKVIAGKVGNGTNIEEKVDLYIDIALIYEATRIAFNEEAAKKLVEGVVSAYKRRQASLKHIKGYVA